MAELTNAIYWEHFDPKVQALNAVPPTADGRFDLAAREALASQLAAQGFIIDRAIMIEGWDAVRTMQIRQQYGYTSFSNAFTATPTIKVSTDAADYSPFTPPPPPFVPSSSPIGPALPSGGEYSVNVSVIWVGGKLMFHDGDLYTENGVTYVFHMFPGMFGPVYYWTVKA